MTRRPPDSKFFIVKVSATFAGTGSANALGDLDFSALDSGHIQIKDSGCGVIPDQFDSFKDVFSGGTLVGNLCFSVPTASVESLVVYVDAGSFNRQRAFFALR